MKKIHLIIIVWLITALPVAGETWHKVTYVVDGDTLYLDRRLAVRLIGINAPELASEAHGEEPYGAAARAFLVKLSEKKMVRLEHGSESKDRYGRTLAYVFLKNGCLLNAEMVENGFAHVLVLGEEPARQALLLALQKKAMAGHLGIWQYWEKKQDPVLGNVSSMRFHTLSCPYGKKTGKRNRKMFSRPVDAFFEGLAPCRQCINEAYFNNR